MVKKKKKPNGGEELKKNSKCRRISDGEVKCEGEGKS